MIDYVIDFFDAVFGVTMAMVNLIVEGTVMLFFVVIYVLMIIGPLSLFAHMIWVLWTWN